MNDLIFSLDPGSIKTGWAVMKAPEQLLQAGVLLPDKQAAGSDFRIHRICEDLRLLLAEWQPAVILIEWISGKVNPRRHHGKGAGLAVHGAATAAIWREALAWRRSFPAEEQIGVKVVLIPENTWTRGVNKKDRQIAIADMFPEYQIDQDRSGDISDSIGLSLWYQQEQKVHQLAEALT